MIPDKDDNIPLSVMTSKSYSTVNHKPGEFTTDEVFQQKSLDNSQKRRWLGRRQTKKPTSKSAVRIETNGELIKVNHLGRIYTKIIHFSVITRYLVYVLPMASLIAIPVVIYAIFRPNALFTNTGVRVYLFWVWIEVFWLSFWGSKLLSKAIPHVFVAVCEIVSAGIQKYAALLHAVELQLNLVIWIVISLVTFTALMSPGFNNQKYQKHWIVVVKNLLGATLVATLLFLGEKMFIQLISINYHRRSFENRIKDNKRCIHLLSLLYEASRALFPVNSPGFKEDDEILNSPLKSKLSKVKENRPGSATPLRFVGEIGKIGDKVTTAFGNIASEITGKQVFVRNSAQGVVSEALMKTRTSESLARRLWMSFAIEDQESLYLKDIKEVLGPNKHEEAEEFFSFIDRDVNGDISLDEMIIKVVDIGRDRKAVEASMRDVGQAIRVLDQVLIAILSVIVIFTFVAFQHISFLTTLATAGTTLLSLSFVFAMTTQEFLGACIFLFVKHPYDVGDRCDINNTALVVEQISLLFTVFKRVDNMRMVQIPNSNLNTLWIENTTRSKSMKEQIELSISLDTPLEDIDILRTTMETFVRHPDNSRDFQSEIIIEATSVNSMDKLSLKLEVHHKSNWHNDTVRAARHNKFMCALILALRKVPIYGPGGHKNALGGPKNPKYTVSVTDEWATIARQNANEEKDRERLAHLLSKDKEETTVNTGQNATFESDVVENQNDRRSNDGEIDSTQAPKEAQASIDRLFHRESQRQGLLKRATTHGRRKPGEAVHVSSRQIYSRPTSRERELTVPRPLTMDGKVMDEEKQVGIFRSLNL